MKLIKFCYVLKLGSNSNALSYAKEDSQKAAHYGDLFMWNAEIRESWFLVYYVKNKFKGKQKCWEVITKDYVILLW